ncbi:Rpn family recombination-promoting nuclease/putative transposase [Nostoc sp. CHAB 5844]|nr:Rpn family recombination-promoting nuclease/putative transposase [Nostoc sp. CHAB 5844]
MKTDTIFYKLFQEFPNIFFELIGKPETNINSYEFKSQEIKEIGFRLDGIFLTLDSTPEISINEPIYFVEVQCYKDKRFYDRLFSREEVKDTAIQKKILELIEAILVNKFPNLSREEIKAMLSMELIKGTRVYEELKEEAKQEVKQELKEELKEEVTREMIAKLLQRGMSVQEVAEILELDVEIIRNVAEEQDL